MRIPLIKHLVGTLLLGISFSGAAQAGDTPPTLDGATLISSQDVAKAQASGATLIDSRVVSEYAEGHIKGAISIPYREKSEKAVTFDAAQDQFDVTKLPADKAVPVIVYCNGPECWKSYKASIAVIKAGYTKVNWYRDGFPDWKSKGLPIE
jgi:rhodanese-related sulfurtransferase